LLRNSRKDNSSKTQDSLFWARDNSVKLNSSKGFQEKENIIKRKIK